MALDFLYEFARARADQLLDIPGGVVVRSRSYPAAHDHNAALVQRPAPPDAVVEAVEDALVDLPYRRVEIAEAAESRGLADALTAAGYEGSRDVIMTLRQLPPEHASGVHGLGVEARDVEEWGVEELGVDERIAVAAAGWAAEQPDWDPDVSRQLGERIRTALSAATCTFFGVRTADGEVHARADLYVRGGVAQVEEVITDVDFRGRGFASALVTAAARRAGAPTVFLVAADDGPLPLYERLGFAVTAHRDGWTRNAAG